MTGIILAKLPPSRGSEMQQRSNMSSVGDIGCLLKIASIVRDIIACFRAFLLGDGMGWGVHRPCSKAHLALDAGSTVLRFKLGLPSITPSSTTAGDRSGDSFLVKEKTPARSQYNIQHIRKTGSRVNQP